MQTFLPLELIVLFNMKPKISYLGKANDPQINQEMYLIVYAML